MLASAVHGVDKDIRDLADEFASHGYIAAAPDLFWRSVPGPLPHDDKRAQPSARSRGSRRSRPAKPTWRIRWPQLRKLPQFNGRAATMGFCYGGPYAILGPKRLGYDAGISCHGTQLLRLHRGARRRHAAGLHHLGRPGPRGAAAEVLDAYRAVPSRMPNVEVHIFPGVLHGYMMPRNTEGVRSPKTREFSMARALAILDGLRGAGERHTLRQAS